MLPQSTPGLEFLPLLLLLHPIRLLAGFCGPATKKKEEKISSPPADASTGTVAPRPTTNGGMQNGSSVGLCTCCVHVFCTLGADLYAQSVLISKISASELSRKLIKGPLLVGPAI